MSDPKGRLDAIELVLQRLPRTHYETARHLFLHLNRCVILGAVLLSLSCPVLTRRERRIVFKPVQPRTK
jgi:hypothetical protein